MPRYIAWMPVNTSAEFALEVDESISEAELKERFLSEALPTGSLRHSCARDLETDFDVVEIDASGLEIRINR